MRKFHEWVREGLHQVRQHQDVNWETGPDEAPPVRFLLSGHGSQVSRGLFGTLRMSRDQNGRGFPFAVTCEFPCSSVSTDRIVFFPLRAHDFYASADRIVEQAVAGSLQAHEAVERVSEVDPEWSLEASGASDYDRYTNEHTVGTLIESLFGDFDDDRKYRFFKNLFDSLLPQRARSTPRLNYGLQFPLGEREPSFAQRTCFWLDVALRVLDTPNADVSFFWPLHSLDSGTAFLLLFVGNPRADALFRFLVSGEPGERIFNLVRAGKEQGGQGKKILPPEYRSLLEDKQLSLQGFLERL